MLNTEELNDLSYIYIALYEFFYPEETELIEILKDNNNNYIKFLNSKNEPDFIKISQTIKNFQKKFDEFQIDDKKKLLKTFLLFTKTEDKIYLITDINEKIEYSEVINDLKDLIYNNEELIEDDKKSKEIYNEIQLISNTISNASLYSVNNNSFQIFQSKFPKYSQASMTLINYEKIFKTIKYMLEQPEINDSYIDLGCLFSDFKNFYYFEDEENCLNLCNEIIEKYNLKDNDDTDFQYFLQIVIRTKILILYRRKNYLECYKLCKSSLIFDEDIELLEKGQYKNIIKIEKACKKKLDKNITSEPVKIKNRVYEIKDAKHIEIEKLIVIIIFAAIMSFIISYKIMLISLAVFFILYFTVKQFYKD